VLLNAVQILQEAVWGPPLQSWPTLAKQWAGSSLFQVQLYLASLASQLAASTRASQATAMPHSLRSSLQAGHNEWSVMAWGPANLYSSRRGTSTAAGTSPFDVVVCARVQQVAKLVPCCTWFIITTVPITCFALGK
jgi:hypothetical protein